MPVNTQNPDLGIYKNIRGFNDYQNAAQAQGLQSALAAAQINTMQQKALGGGNSPAAIQIANEYQAARQSGDLQRMNDIELFTKALDKGLVTGANGVQALGGYGQAAGDIAAQKKGMEQQAQKDVDLVMNPKIKTAEKVATLKGEKEDKLAGQVARMPELMATVNDLRSFSKDATYTLGGQAFDALSRQVGYTTEGAVARKEFDATISNQVLPLLRETFGAAFTAKEGESLRETLGDINASPEEKIAAIDRFVTQQIRNTQSLSRELDQPMPDEYYQDDEGNYRSINDIPPIQPILKTGTKKGGYTYVGGDPANPKSWKK